MHIPTVTIALNRTDVPKGRHEARKIWHDIVRPDKHTHYANAVTEGLDSFKFGRADNEVAKEILWTCSQAYPLHVRMP